MQENKRVRPLYLVGGTWTRKYRLTFLFALTALVVIAIAALIANRVIGDLAEDNLVRLAADNTAREALHIEAMLAGRHSMPGMVSMESTAGSPMQHVQPPGPVTLESVLASEERLEVIPSLVVGLNIVKVSLLDFDGRTVWSTDPGSIGAISEGSTVFTKASDASLISDGFSRGKVVVDLSGTRRPVDVVGMYLPLRESASGDILGTIEIFRDVSGEVSIQVDEVKQAVFWTTIATMGGLLLALLGFIVAADLAIQRSRRREMSLAEEANRTLEDRVRERTRELEEANSRLLDAQEQLVRTERLSAIGQLAGGVAHDLRNPLGAIRNAVYYLKGKLGSTELAASNPRVGQFLQIVEDEVDHSNNIISDLLSFSRVTSPTLSSTDVGAVLDSTIYSLEIRDDVRIVKALDPELPEVMADGEQLRRVFANLANNAQDAMPEGGELTIGSYRVDGHVELAFSDTGMGISEEDMKKIFDPLYTTKTKGTGLGLAICQEILLKQGGAIGAVSEIGEGATFTVRLPIAAAKGEEG